MIAPNKISFNDFSREPPELLVAELEACRRVFSSSRWILSDSVTNFEQQWSTHCGTDYAIGVANGMDALEISLRCLGIAHGDEVITTSLTAFATTLSIVRCGATPVFADIDPRTACIDSASISQHITESTKAILVVHLYGRSVQLDEIKILCTTHNLFLLEDCAQAHGALFGGKPVGSYGDLAAWSFYPTKNLGAIGDAGAITTSNPVYTQKARILRNYGQSDRYHHLEFGLNSRLDELQASLLLERISYLQTWTELRRSIAYRYWNEISNPLITLLEPPSDPLTHVHHLFVLRTPDRLGLQNHLSDYGISTLIHYPIPCHLQPAYLSIVSSKTALLNTEEFSSTCLSLPIHPYMTEEEVTTVIEACNTYY